MRFSGEYRHPYGSGALWDPEGVTITIDHQHLRPRPQQLAGPRPFRVPGRVQRERKGYHRQGTRRGSSPAGDPRAVAAPTLDQRYGRIPASQYSDYVEPRGILLIGGTRCPCPPHPVGLEDTRHRCTMIEPCLPRRKQVGAVHPSACSMRHRQQEGWSPDVIELNVGSARTCGDLHPAQRNPRWPNSLSRRDVVRDPRPAGGWPG